MSFKQGKPAKGEIFAVNAIAQGAWVLGSWLGCTMGGLISDVRPYGLDYAWRRCSLLAGAGDQWIVFRWW